MLEGQPNLRMQIESPPDRDAHIMPNSWSLAWSAPILRAPEFLNGMQAMAKLHKEGKPCTSLPGAW